MRITGGQAGGRQLKVPKGLDVRPTPDKVKQAIFNSLGERVIGARVLELFAGSGALSLESLSRGAVSVLSIEKSPRHADFIQQNASAPQFPPHTLQVRVQDAFTAVKQLAEAGQQFDLVLADPPYGEKNVGHRSRSLAQQLLDDANVAKILAPDGIFIIGHTKRDTVELPVHLREYKVMKHGDTMMRFFHHG